MGPAELHAAVKAARAERIEALVWQVVRTAGRKAKGADGLAAMELAGVMVDLFLMCRRSPTGQPDFASLTAEQVAILEKWA